MNGIELTKFVLYFVMLAPVLTLTWKPFVVFFIAFSLYDLLCYIQINTAQNKREK